MTAAELLSIAAFDEGRFAQAIPSFGSERMGAPVVAFCRIADHPIRTREPVMAPHVVVVGDATLVHHVDLFSGLAPGGAVLLNTARSLDVLGLSETATARGWRVATVAATELALEHVGRPVPSAALLGGLCALTGAVSLDAVRAALLGRFASTVGKGNVAAANAGYAAVTSQGARPELAGVAGSPSGVHDEGPALRATGG